MCDKRRRRWNTGRMAVNSPVAARMDRAEVDALKEQARRLAQSLGKRVTVSDVVRIAVQDYLRRIS